jgi:hypothetical protein
MKQTGWSLAQLKDAADEIGYLLQDGFVVKGVIVNDRVERSLVETIERAEEKITYTVIGSSRDRQLKNDAAPWVLKKVDVVGQHCASKSVPQAEVKWKVLPTKLLPFFEIVKRETAKLEPKVKTPDGYWAALTSTTFKMHQRVYGVDPCAFFRLKFDFDQVEVHQGVFGNRVTTQVNVWIADYTSGKKSGNLHEEPIELCLVVGPNKDWNKKILKNVLLEWFFPDRKPPLSVVNESPTELTVVDASQVTADLSAHVINTYFSIKDREAYQGSWYRDVIEDERCGTLKPIVLETNPVLQAPNETFEFLEPAYEEDEQEVCFNVIGRETSSEEGEKNEEIHKEEGTGSGFLSEIISELQELERRNSRLEATRSTCS